MHNNQENWKLLKRVDETCTLHKFTTRLVHSNDEQETNRKIEDNEQNIESMRQMFNENFNMTSSCWPRNWESLDIFLEKKYKDARRWYRTIILTKEHYWSTFDPMTNMIFCNYFLFLKLSIKSHKGNPEIETTLTALLRLFRNEIGNEEEPGNDINIISSNFFFLNQSFTF